MLAAPKLVAPTLAEPTLAATLPPWLIVAPMVAAPVVAAFCTDACSGGPHSVLVAAPVDSPFKLLRSIDAPVAKLVTTSPVADPIAVPVSTMVAAPVLAPVAALLPQEQQAQLRLSLHLGSCHSGHGSGCPSTHSGCPSTHSGRHLLN